MSDKKIRDRSILFRVSQQEYDLMQQKAELAGTDNLSAYIRKMAIDGYVIKLELPELKEMVSLLRRTSNNINQIAQRVNSTGRVYAGDLEEIQRQQKDLWECGRQILKKLAVLE